MLHHNDLENFDAPAVVFSGDSYYLRFNDPKEFLDIPGYPGAWQNLDGLDRDRRIHVINTPAVNGQNLDYAPDWYPTSSQSLNFKKSTDEEKAVIFGLQGSVPSTTVDLQPGEFILRDQRWLGLLTGQEGERHVQIELGAFHVEVLEVEGSYVRIPVTLNAGMTLGGQTVLECGEEWCLLDGPLEEGVHIARGLEQDEISDKFISTYVSQPIDTTHVHAVEHTHIVTDLYNAGNFVTIGSQWYTVLHYDKGKLYLKEDTSGVQPGMQIQSYWDFRFIPINDNQRDAFSTGTRLLIGGEEYWVLDHFPNARSLALSKEGESMYANGIYRSKNDHIDSPWEENFRFLPEIWQGCAAPTTHLYLSRPLEASYTQEPFGAVNKQWYVASVENADTLPEDHKPECWKVLRIGGHDVPYRFKRFVFPTWEGQMLDGDLVYSYGPQHNAPFTDTHWLPEDINPFPTWYQKMDGWATFSRVLTVPDLEFFNSMAPLGEMFLCNLRGDSYRMNLPSQVGPEGLNWETWVQPLFGAEIYYV